VLAPGHLGEARRPEHGVDGGYDAVLAEPLAGGFRFPDLEVARAGVAAYDEMGEHASRGLVPDVAAYFAVHVDGGGDP